jgi:hypothetical protein
MNSSMVHPLGPGAFFTMPDSIQGTKWANIHKSWPHVKSVAFADG